jgi:type IV pilus biogenesis protein CpaD/CtpE
LIIIDGGRGQLAAAIAARDEAEQTMPMIGLAKKREEVVISKNGSLIGSSEKDLLKISAQMKAYVSQSADFINIELPDNSHAVKLLSGDHLEPRVIHAPAERFYNPSRSLDLQPALR